MRVKSLESIGLGLYAVREDGCVFHTGNLTWVKPDINHSGYCRVQLFTDDGIKFIATSNIKTKQLSEMFNVSKTCIKYHRNSGRFVKEQ